MTVQGFVRARKHQFGRQAVAGTPVAATRAYPFKGVPSVVLNWTDEDIDTGSIVVTVAPQRGAEDVTAPLTGPFLSYDDAATLLCAIFGGHESPSGAGAAKHWTHEPAAIPPLDPRDLFTYEFGDDVQTDWYQLFDGVLESLEIVGPEGLGKVTHSETWRFGGWHSTGSTDNPVVGTVPTPSLDVDTNPPIVYGKDMALYIADAIAGLGAGQILNALHTFTLTITATYDEKRFYNGDQSFDVDEHALTGYEVVFSATYAKTDDTVGTGSESDAWMSDDAVDRYIRLKFTSVPFITGSTPYSWQITMPARYYTRTEGDVGGNTVIVLEAHAFFDPDDADNFIESLLTNAVDSADIGSTPTT